MPSGVRVGRRRLVPLAIPVTVTRQKQSRKASYRLLISSSKMIYFLFYLSPALKKVWLYWSVRDSEISKRFEMKIRSLFFLRVGQLVPVINVSDH